MHCQLVFVFLVLAVVEIFCQNDQEILYKIFYLVLGLVTDVD